MMDIINRRHEDIILNRRTNVYAYINFIDKKRILFSVKASKSFGLAEGMFVHFIRDDSYWAFYVNNDQDGFPLKQRKHKKNIELFNTGLISVFTRNVGCNLPAKYPLRLSGAKKDGCQLIEIDLNHRIY